MARIIAGVRRFYGQHPLHLLLLLGCFALVGYAALSLSAQAPWPRVALWFAGAVIAHDLVLFPLYAFADRLLTRPRRARRLPGGRIAAVNHVRIPVLASGLLLVVFFPGIIEQGGETFTVATGQTQSPFLARWLLLTAAFFALSALLYLVRVASWHRARHRKS